MNDKIKNTLWNFKLNRTRITAATEFVHIVGNQYTHSMFSRSVKSSQPVAVISHRLETVALHFHPGMPLILRVSHSCDTVRFYYVVRVHLTIIIPVLCVPPLVSIEKKLQIQFYSSIRNLKYFCWRHFVRQRPDISGESERGMMTKHRPFSHWRFSVL